jgi:hypothetical protein
MCPKDEGRTFFHNTGILDSHRHENLRTYTGIHEFLWNDFLTVTKWMEHSFVIQFMTHSGGRKEN